MFPFGFGFGKRQPHHQQPPPARMGGYPHQVHPDQPNGFAHGRPFYPNQQQLNNHPHPPLQQHNHPRHGFMARHYQCPQQQQQPQQSAPQQEENQDAKNDISSDDDASSSSSDDEDEEVKLDELVKTMRVERLSDGSIIIRPIDLVTNSASNAIPAATPADIKLLRSALQTVRQQNRTARKASKVKSKAARKEAKIARRAQRQAAKLAAKANKLNRSTGDVAATTSVATPIAATPVVPQTVTSPSAVPQTTPVEPDLTAQIQKYEQRVDRWQRRHQRWVEKAKAHHEKRQNRKFCSMLRKRAQKAEAAGDTAKKERLELLLQDLETSSTSSTSSSDSNDDTSDPIVDQNNNDISTGTSNSDSEFDPHYHHGYMGRGFRHYRHHFRHHHMMPPPHHHGYPHHYPHHHHNHHHGYPHHHSHHRRHHDHYHNGPIDRFYNMINDLPQVPQVPPVTAEQIQGALVNVFNVVRDQLNTVVRSNNDNNNNNNINTPSTEGTDTTTEENSETTTTTQSQPTTTESYPIPSIADLFNLLQRDLARAPDQINNAADQVRVAVESLPDQINSVADQVNDTVVEPVQDIDNRYITPTLTNLQAQIAQHQPELYQILVNLQQQLMGVAASFQQQPTTSTSTQAETEGTETTTTATASPPQPTDTAVAVPRCPWLRPCGGRNGYGRRWRHAQQQDDTANATSPPTEVAQPHGFAPNRRHHHRRRHHYQQPATESAQAVPQQQQQQQQPIDYSPPEFLAYFLRQLAGPFQRSAQSSAGFINSFSNGTDPETHQANIDRVPIEDLTPQTPLSSSNTSIPTTTTTTTTTGSTIESAPSQQNQQEQHGDKFDKVDLDLDNEYDFAEYMLGQIQSQLLQSQSLSTQSSQKEGTTTTIITPAQNLDVSTSGNGDVDNNNEPTIISCSVPAPKPIICTVGDVCDETPAEQQPEEQQPVNVEPLDQSLPLIIDIIDALEAELEHEQQIKQQQEVATPVPKPFSSLSPSQQPISTPVFAPLQSTVINNGNDDEIARTIEQLEQEVALSSPPVQVQFQAVPVVVESTVDPVQVVDDSVPTAPPKVEVVTPQEPIPQEQTPIQPEQEQQVVTNNTDQFDILFAHSNELYAKRKHIVDAYREIENGPNPNQNKLRLLSQHLKRVDTMIEETQAQIQLLINDSEFDDELEALGLSFGK